MAATTANPTVDALRAIGLNAKAKGDTLTITVGGHKATFTVVTGRTPEAVLASAPKNPTLLVADRISQGLRDRLDQANIAWHDRRGHLKARQGPVWVDTDVPAEAKATTATKTSPLAGSVVSLVSVAALVAYPDPIPGVRELARDHNVSPGGVSDAVKRLTQAGYLTMNRRASVPALFDEISDTWRPDWIEIGHLDPEPAVMAVGGVAAAAIGAPVLATSTQPLELLVADETTFRRIRRQGPPPGSGRVTRVALAPGGLLAPDPGGVTVEGHRVAVPALVALVVAQDRARGHEILQGWEFDDRPW